MKTTKLQYKAKTIEGVIQAPGERMREEVKEHFLNTNLIIEIRLDRKKRTTAENNYYWGVILVHLLRAFKDFECPWLSEHNPEHLQHIHEIVKQKFFFDSAPNIIDPEGNVYKGKLTTTGQNTVEWEEKMTAIRTWAFEVFGITIPLPNENLTNPLDSLLVDRSE